jgi:hypothetical protein
MIKAAAPILIICSLSYAQTPADPQWVIQQKTELLKICQLRTEGHAGQSTFNVIVDIGCVSGKNKTFSISIVIPSASKFKYLNLDAISDWDLYGSNKDLVFCEKNKHSQFRFMLGGSLTAEYSNDEFTIPLYYDSQLSNVENKLVYRLLSEISRSGGEWTVKISNPTDNSQTVTIPISFDGAKDFLGECLTPSHSKKHRPLKAPQ